MTDDRFAQNTAHTEQLLDELGIPLPDRVARSRALILSLGELDVVMRQPLSRDQLAQRALAMLEAGQDVDLVSLVSENSALGLTGDADGLLRAMNDHAEMVHEQNIRGARTELLPVVRAETEAIIDLGRKYPDAPPTADDAVSAGPSAVKVYQTFRGVVDRYGKLRALHAELLAGYVDPTAFALFRDSKARPTFSTPHTVAKAAPAGPSDPLRRLLWLGTPDAKFWVPTGPEATAYYFEVLAEQQKPKAAPEPSSTATVPA